MERQAWSHRWGIRWVSCRCIFGSNVCQQSFVWITKKHPPMAGPMLMQVGTVLLQLYQKRWVFLFATAHYEKASSTCLPFEKIPLCQPIRYLFGWKLLHWLYFGQRVRFELHFDDPACPSEILFGKQWAKSSGFGWRRNARWSNFAVGFIF